MVRVDQIRGVDGIDGVEFGRGKGRDVLGHPLTALAWLANHLAARGRCLRRGDIVREYNRNKRNKRNNWCQERSRSGW